MSILTATWKTVKTQMSEDLIRKVTQLVEVKDRYIANIESDLLHIDPELRKEFLDELEDIAAQNTHISKKKKISKQLRALNHKETEGKFNVNPLLIRFEHDLITEEDIREEIHYQGYLLREKRKFNKKFNI